MQARCIAAGHAVVHGGLIGGLLVAVLHTAIGTWVVAAGHAVTAVLEGEVLAAVARSYYHWYGVTKHVWLKLVVAGWCLWW